MLNEEKLISIKIRKKESCLLNFPVLFNIKLAALAKAIRQDNKGVTNRKERNKRIFICR